MDCWEVLGISPTVNKRDIKIAYTNKLKFCRPDKDPEGFKLLKKAFDEAQDQSRYVNDTEGETSHEVELLKENLTDVNPKHHPDDWSSGISDEEIISVEALEKTLILLYRDMNRRDNLECWQSVFKSPVTLNLDMTEDVEDCIVSFFCYNNLLSAQVLHLFSSVFHFESEFTRFESRPYYEQARYLYYYLDSVSRRMPYPQADDVKAMDTESCLRMLYFRRLLEDKLIFNDISPLELLEFYNQEKSDTPDNVACLFVGKELMYGGFFEYCIAMLTSLGEFGYPLEKDLVLGECFYRKGEYERALDYFQKYAEVAQDSSVSLMKSIGLCLYNMQENEAACDLLAGVLSLKPHDFEVRMYVTVLISRLIEEAEANENLDQSFKLGSLLQEAGMYKEALEFVRPAMSNHKLWFLHQKSDRIDTVAAKCYAQMGQYDEANAEFYDAMKKALDQDVNCLDIIVDFLEYCDGHFDSRTVSWASNFEKELTLAAEHNASYAFAAAKLYAILPENNGYYSDNEEETKKKACYFINLAVEMDMGNAGFHLLRMQIMQASLNYKEVIKSGQMASRLFAGDYNLNYMLGNAYYEMNNYEGAIRYFEEAVAIDPDRSSSFELLVKLTDLFAYFGQEKQTITYLKSQMEWNVLRVDFAVDPLKKLISACEERAIMPTPDLLSFMLYLMDKASDLDEIPERRGTREYMLAAHGIMSKEEKARREKTRREEIMLLYVRLFLRIAEVTEEKLNGKFSDTVKHFKELLEEVENDDEE